MPVSPTGAALELALRVASQIRLGLETEDFDMVRLARGLEEALDGALAVDRQALGRDRLRELAARLEMELLVGRLVPERAKVPTLRKRDKDEEEPPPVSLASREEPEASFIAVRLLDQKSKAVVAQRFSIELPDGSLHRGVTDPDGFARVRGFRKDGTAKVRFPRFDELDFKTRSASERLIIPVNDEAEEDEGDEEVDKEALKVSEEDQSAADVPPVPPLEGDDVPGPPAHFELAVLDHRGQSLAGVDVMLSFSGDTQFATTDDAGVARFEDVPALKARASLVDSEQARELVRPRFKAEPEPSEVTDDSVAIRPLTTPFNPVPLDANKSGQLQLRPSVESHEIPGATFEFGRSFVRSSAIQQLSEIAEALRNTTDMMAMIFGHTDISGGEALNKELSERRARAVHALLTNDSGAWEQLFSGTADGPNWKEKWDVEEAQHMLNALGCADDSGAPLVENDKRDEPTKQAIHRFQRGDFPDRPVEQAPLPESDNLGADGRRALFLAYAKRISRQPIAPDRFAPISGSRFMGCGEFNPLSSNARDEASRRVHIFVLDPVAVPDDLPCALRKLGPCQANITAPVTEPDPDGKPPFRCKIFKKLAAECTSAPSPDLNHDLVLKFPLSLSQAGERAHKYTLVADDDTITIERSLADDTRARDDGRVELTFEHLPELHRYRLTCDDGEQPPYTVFDFASLKELQEHFRADEVDASLDLPSDFLTHLGTAEEPPSDDATASDDESADEDEAEA